MRLVNTKNLKNDAYIYTVVQPHLCVICDETKLDARGAIGTTELMIGLLLPGNSKKEMRYKYDLEQIAGVLEYWIVNLENKAIFIYFLKEGVFVGQHPLIEDDRMESPLFTQLDFKLEDIFN